MNKEQFLAAIRARLAGLPPKDLEKPLEYYLEMIEDRIEDGLTEEEAVAAIGPVEDIANQILAEIPLPEPVEMNRKPSKGGKAWKITLLILLSPIWATLLLAAGIIVLSLLVVVLSLYIAVWSILLALYAADLGLAAGAVFGGVGSVMLLCTGHALQSMLFLGGSLLCGGFAILLFFGTNQLTRCSLWLGKAMARWVRSWFTRKGGAK